MVPDWSETYAYIFFFFYARLLRNRVRSSNRVILVYISYKFNFQVFTVM